MQLALSAALKNEPNTPGASAGSHLSSRPRPTDLDPRPDLTGDHRLWVAVLATALFRNRKLHGLLHGLRCLGAGLSVKESSSGGRFLKLNYQPALDTWSEDKLRAGWLDPHKDDIKWVFREALEVKERADAEFPRRNKQSAATQVAGNSGKETDSNVSTSDDAGGSGPIKRVVDGFPGFIGVDSLQLPDIG